MKTRYLICLTAITIAACCVLAHCLDTTPFSRFAMAAPPLSLEGLLDEKLPEATPKKAPLPVDNSSCYVCHGKLDEEPLVIVHGKAEVSCIDCHGKSLAHRNDEDNATAPDTMYALEDVDTMCGECHEEHDVSARKVLRRWQQRCPQKTDAKQIVCTDCHFRHRIARRTVRWNKKTGALIIRPRNKD